MVWDEIKILLERIGRGYGSREVREFLKELYKLDKEQRTNTLRKVLEIVYTVRVSASKELIEKFVEEQDFTIDKEKVKKFVEVLVNNKVIKEHMLKGLLEDAKELENTLKLQKLESNLVSEIQMLRLLTDRIIKDVSVIKDDVKDSNIKLVNDLEKFVDRVKKVIETAEKVRESKDVETIKACVRQLEHLRYIIKQIFTSY